MKFRSWNRCKRYSGVDKVPTSFSCLLHPLTDDDCVLARMGLLLKQISAAALLTFMLADSLRGQASGGNLSIIAGSGSELTGVVPGGELTIIIQGRYGGEDGLLGFAITDTLSPSTRYVSASPEPVSIDQNVVQWHFDITGSEFSAEITLHINVNDDVLPGTTVTNAGTISSTLAEEDYDDNVFIVEVDVIPPLPDLFTSMTGTLDIMRQGGRFETELGTISSFTIQYSNSSIVTATHALLVDTLPPELAYVSAHPEPSSIDGQVIRWEVGTVDYFENNEVELNVRSIACGNTAHTVSLHADQDDVDRDDNTSTLEFAIRPILNPTITNPVLSEKDESDVITTGTNPTFEGISRTGAIVRLYNVDSVGCGEPSELCHPVLLGEAVADASRRWSITPTSMRDSALYLVVAQGEFHGELSLPPEGSTWEPIPVVVDPYLDTIGLDPRHFSITIGGMVYRPGAFGCVVGIVPGKSAFYSLQRFLPDTILSDPSGWQAYSLYATSTSDGGTIIDTIPPYSIRQISIERLADGDTGKQPFYGQLDWEIHKNHEAVLNGMYRIEANMAAGRAQTAERMINLAMELTDPAGYVYDLDAVDSIYIWPRVPPKEALIPTARITLHQRESDSTWSLWPASEYSQVNPQVTDNSTPDSVLVPGYFSFLVDAGQYRVTASAPGYFDASSGNLTVVNTPVYYNIGMRSTHSVISGVRSFQGRSVISARSRLFQNYPNPFNPTTVIRYSLSVVGHTTLMVYDVMGREVSILVDEVKQPGEYTVLWDASKFSSGVYFCRLQSGGFVKTKKLLFIK